MATCKKTGYTAIVLETSSSCSAANRRPNSLASSAGDERTSARNVTTTIHVGQKDAFPMPMHAISEGTQTLLSTKPALGPQHFAWRVHVERHGDENLAGEQRTAPSWRATETSSISHPLLEVDVDDRYAS